MVSYFCEAYFTQNWGIVQAEETDIVERMFVERGGRVSRPGINIIASD